MNEYKAIHVAGTGHRPPKAGLTYSHCDVGDDYAVKLAIKFLLDHSPIERVIVGGALGFDTLLAKAAYLLDIPFHVYAPCLGQERKWPVNAQKRYRNMLTAAEDVRYITYGEYAPGVMGKRNRAMVNDAEIIVAYYDGSEGGTQHCVEYAQAQKVPVVNLLERS